MTEKTIEYCQRTLAMKDPPPETYFNLGLAYCQEGRYGPAVRSFKTFLKAKPDYPNAYKNLGLAYQHLKRWQEAVQSFEEELRRHPGDPYSHLYLGDLYFERKAYQEALFHFKKCLGCPRLSDKDEVVRVQKIISRIEGVSRRSGQRDGRRDRQRLERDPIGSEA